MNVRRKAKVSRRIHSDGDDGWVVERPKRVIGKTATTVEDSNGVTKVRYHTTDVVMFNDKEIVLDSGGWMTNTTKKRMNQASQQFNLGYNVYQRDNKWFVTYKGATQPFSDGMSLDRN